MYATLKGGDSQMTDKPRFVLELYLSQTATRFTVDDPTLITEQMVNQAWDMVNTFVEDMLDGQELEVDDERFREIFIELCYRLIFREMTTLCLLPRGEAVAMKAIKAGKRYYGPRKSKGDTDETD
jgi:hypothetical protein